MKKFIALFIVLAVLAPVVFAQDAGLTFGGWGRGIFAPIQVRDPDPGDSKAYAGVGKWSAFPEVGFNVIGNWGQIGIEGDILVIENDAATPAIGDNAYIWAKPWDFLKVSVGKFNDDTLRGKIGDGNFDGNITLSQNNADAIFTRFQGNGLGAEVALTPIEGLYIAAEVNAGHFPVDGTNPEVKYVYEKIQIGAGYEIANIGHARAQFIGGDGTFVLPAGIPDSIPTANAPRVEVAFALTAVENLLVDLGAKIWFPATKVLSPTADDQFNTETAPNGGSLTNPIGISVGAKYDLDAFSIVGRIDTKVAGSYKDDANVKGSSGFELNAHLIPSYNLGFATVGADIGFLLNPQLTYEVGGTSYTINEGGVAFGLGAWIQKGFGNGLIKTGIGVQLPTTTAKVKIPPADTTTETKNPMVLTIPVILEYWF